MPPRTWGRSLRWTPWLAFARTGLARTPQVEEEQSKTNDFDRAAPVVRKQQPTAGILAPTWWPLCSASSHAARRRCADAQRANARADGFVDSLRVAARCRRQLAVRVRRRAAEPALAGIRSPGRWKRALPSSRCAEQFGPAREAFPAARCRRLRALSRARRRCSLSSSQVTSSSAMSRAWWCVLESWPRRRPGHDDVVAGKYQRAAVDEVEPDFSAVRSRPPRAPDVTAGQR
jgi:hypothetical protein